MERQESLATKDLANLIELVTKRWTLGSTHGISHWKRVAENGVKLQTLDVDPIVVQYFAYLHDSYREDDGEDCMHGERAAEWIITLRDTYLRYLTDLQFHQLQEACRLHTVEHRTGDPTIDACFDADRLDLWRVGIKPDPNLMATEIGADLARALTCDKMFELIMELEGLDTE